MVSGPAWYKSGRWDELEQGDLLPDCPILVPPENLRTLLDSATSGDEIEIPSLIGRADVIIATQTCDLQQTDKIDNVVVCGYQPASSYPAGIRGHIYKGRTAAHFMLEKCGIRNHKFEHQIVDLRAVYSLPIEFVREFAQNLGTRVRLNSPYKENFAKKFGDVFSRIALPRDLSDPSKKGK